MDTPFKIALLFPGQGSQAVGMGRELFESFPAAKATFEEADDALGFKLSDIIFNGPAEQLDLTEHTQPAILAASIACLRVFQEALQSHALQPHALQPCFAAGHSLGEYTAHVAAGTLSFADALRTVRLRGQFMQQAVPAGEGAMAAILGLPEPRVNDLCAEASDELAGPAWSDPTPSESELPRQEVVRSVVSPANLNSPEQTVISGSREAVARAVELCKAAGARKAILLKVSAPFHCALMQPAQHQLTSVLEAIPLSDPAFPVACNVDARLLTRHTDVLDALIRQVTGPVRWVECLELLVTQGATHLIEVGPGRVLTGLSRQILKKHPAEQQIMCLSVHDKATLDKTLAAFTFNPSPVE